MPGPIQTYVFQRMKYTFVVRCHQIRAKTHFYWFAIQLESVFGRSTSSIIASEAEYNLFFSLSIDCRSRLATTTTIAAIKTANSKQNKRRRKKNTTADANKSAIAFAATCWHQNVFNSRFYWSNRKLPNGFELIKHMHRLECTIWKCNCQMHWLKASLSIKPIHNFHTHK